jgi:hypothetical protein
MGFTAYDGYIEKLGGNGWIRVKFDDGTEWPLPEYLRVHVSRSGKREGFKVLEGRFFGKTATVVKKGWSWSDWDWDKSYFEEGSAHKGPVTMTFYRKSKYLEVAGLGKIDTITLKSNPVPVGTHEIEIPYEVHSLGSGYTSRAKYAKTWFRIGHSGDRFLHCGRVSAGCITVTDIEQWDKIYNRLIVARKNLVSVGTVTVIDR